jgi:hypothetical protein
MGRLASPVKTGTRKADVLRSGRAEDETLSIPLREVTKRLITVTNWRKLVVGVLLAVVT